MLQALFASITTDDVRALGEAGVPAPRVSEWKKGKGLPDIAAAKALAIVKGVPLADIADELADLRANDQQKSFFRRATKAARNS